MSNRTRALWEENRKAARSLSQASNIALDDISERLRAVPISAYQIETVRQDVIRMLADAEARGASPKDVLGEDYGAFCDSVLEALPKPPAWYSFLLSLRSLLRLFVRCSVVSLVIHLPENLTGVRQNYTPFDLPESVRQIADPQHFTITVGFLIGWALLLIAMYVMSVWHVDTAGRRRTGSESMLNVLLYALLLAAMVGVGVLFPHELFRVHISIVLVVLAALYGLYKLLDAKLD